MNVCVVLMVGFVCCVVLLFVVCVFVLYDDDYWVFLVMVEFYVCYDG